MEMDFSLVYVLSLYNTYLCLFYHGLVKMLALCFIIKHDTILNNVSYQRSVIYQRSPQPCGLSSCSVFRYKFVDLETYIYSDEDPV